MLKKIVKEPIEHRLIEDIESEATKNYKKTIIFINKFIKNFLKNEQHSK